MKVYTVIHTIRHDSEWLDTNVVGVFSSKEKAINAIFRDLLAQYNEEIAACYGNKHIKAHGNSYLSACLDDARSSIHFVSDEQCPFESYFRRKSSFYYSGLHIYGVAEFDLDAKELTNDNANDS